MNFPSKTVSKTSKKTSNSSVPRMFWKFGADYHGDEAIRADVTDFIIFTLIALLCAWPIASAAISIVGVFTNY